MKNDFGEKFRLDGLGNTGIYSMLMFVHPFGRGYKHQIGYRNLEFKYNIYVWFPSFCTQLLME